MVFLLTNLIDIPDEVNSSIFFEIGVIGKSKPFIGPSLCQAFENTAMDETTRYAYVRDFWSIILAIGNEIFLQKSLSFNINL